MRKSSKKSTLMMSVEDVEGNDELLVEILVRLPPKSIFKCQCVSKRWSAIIAEPHFRQSYRAKQQLSGAGGRLLAFFQERSLFCRVPAPSSRPFLNILPIVQQHEQKIKPMPDSFGTAVQSSGGLFLFDDYRTYPNRTYRVVNPLSRKWVQLPPPLTPDRLYGVGLDCKENTEKLVPSFKVVGVVNKFSSMEEKKCLDIETYSYETGRWTMSTLVATEELHTLLFLKLVHKGVFHWCTRKKSIAVYNSNRDENCVVLLKLPQSIDDVTATRSSTDDLLWIGTGYSKWMGGRGILSFWKLPIDDYDSYKCATTIPVGQWVFMHVITSSSLYNEMSLVLESKKRKINETNAGSNRYIKLEALIPSSPVAAVLNLQQKIFLYNLESYSLELVQYRGRPYGETCIAGWLPFLESLSLSSYGPLASTYE